MEQVKFTYFPLEKQVDAVKSLNLSNKTDELKQMEGILRKSLLSDFIICKLRDIIQLFAESNFEVVLFTILCFK